MQTTFISSLKLEDGQLARMVVDHFENKNYLIEKNNVKILYQFLSGQAALRELCDLLSLTWDSFMKCFESFIHKSFVNEYKFIGIKDNERLEFLGDTVIGLYISEALIHKFPHDSEGNLSRYRSQLVCRDTLAELSKSIGLSKLILLGKGELFREGFTNKSLLADFFEAFIGSIYIHFGKDKTWKCLEKIILEYESIILKSFWALEKLEVSDAKSGLQEKALAIIGELPLYTSEKVAENYFKVSVYIKGSLMAEAGGKSKKLAEKKAAEKALEFNFNEIKGELNVN